MATDSVVIWKTVLPLFSVVLDGSLFILTGNDDIHKSLDDLKFSQIGPRTTEIAALKGVKNLCFHFFSLCIMALR